MRNYFAVDDSIESTQSKKSFEWEETNERPPRNSQ